MIPRASPKEKSSRSQPSVAIKVAPVDAMVLVATSGSKQPPETSDVATACRCRKPDQRALHAVSMPAQLNMQGLPPQLEMRVQACKPAANLIRVRMRGLLRMATCEQQIVKRLLQQGEAHTSPHRAAYEDAVHEEYARAKDCWSPSAQAVVRANANTSAVRFLNVSALVKLNDSRSTSLQEHISRARAEALACACAVACAHAPAVAAADEQPNALPMDTHSDCASASALANATAKSEARFTASSTKPSKDGSQNAVTSDETTSMCASRISVKVLEFALLVHVAVSLMKITEGLPPSPSSAWRRPRPGPWRKAATAAVLGSGSSAADAARSATAAM